MNETPPDCVPRSAVASICFGIVGLTVCFIQFLVYPHWWNDVSFGYVAGPYEPPLTAEEVDTLLKQIDTGTTAPRQKEQYYKGDNIRIIDGPFLGFNGLIDDVDQERGRVKVLVSIFGRGTPVELGFSQIERV